MKGLIKPLTSFILLYLIICISVPSNEMKVWHWPERKCNVSVNTVNSEILSSGHSTPSSPSLSRSPSGPCCLSRPIASCAHPSAAAYFSLGLATSLALMSIPDPCLLELPLALPSHLPPHHPLHSPACRMPGNIG